MKKVALVTFHTPLSIGAQLQAFALQEAIFASGYDCRVVNYAPPPAKNRYVRLSLSRRVYGGISNIIFGKKIQKQYSRFKDWKFSYLKQTEPIGTVSQLQKESEKFDLFICGSDQIWRNPGQGYFFLDFTPDSARRVAYAPSFGNINFTDSSKKIIKTYLSRFSFISIRETDGAEFASNLLGRDIPQVLDPTLLWPSDYWKNYAADNVGKLPGKYLLVFSIQDTIACFKAAKRIGARLGIPLVVVDTARRLIWHPFLKNYFDVGPAEFLRLVDGADFIVTSSFHGTAFAVNYGKRFLTICRDGHQNVNSRITSLADILGIRDRLISPNGDIPASVFDELNPMTDALLREERERCRNILTESLLPTQEKKL